MKSGGYAATPRASKTLHHRIKYHHNLSMLAPEEGRLPVTFALKTLKDYLPQIRTVSDWAAYHGYSREAFTRLVRDYHQSPPAELIRAERLRLVREILSRSRSPNCYSIAREVGLNDEKALNAFVKSQVGVPPREWRAQLLERVCCKN